MLAIPYVARTGHTQSFKFRRIDDSDRPKYDSPAGQRVRLYNARSLSEGGPLAVVCEGEFDAIVAQSTLGAPAVGIPGTGSWQDHWSRCFGDFDRVIVVADHDAKEDGTDPGMKLALSIQRKIPGAELVVPPPGKDMTDWVLEDGADVVRRACGL